jgi:small-conductance mechanosensitive channel
MVKQDIPNSVLGRFLTLEMLGMVVLIAVSWGTLTSKVAGLDNQVSEAKAIQALQAAESKSVTSELSKEVNDINRKVDVLGNNQIHFKQQIDAVDDKLEKIQELLEQHRGTH